VKIIIISFFIPLLIHLYPASNSADHKVAKILHQMFDSIRYMKSVQYKINSVERHAKEFVKASTEIKLQIQPRKLYFHNPAKKVEILYNPDISVTKALVKTGSLPYIPVLLDPTGNIMRKNQHYSIHELGFAFIGKALALTISKDPQGLNNFVLHGKCQKNNRSCYFIEYNNNQFTYQEYKVGQKETVTSIAIKLNVHEHILRYKNNLHNDFGYLRSGTILQVPNLYIKRAVIYIDEKTFIPISISAFDENELFEIYDFSDIELNKHFTDLDFDRNNKLYHF